MTEWSILDGNPAPGDPRAVGRLARQFGRAAEDFQEGRARLHRMMSGSAMPSWQGPAATAFAGGLEPLRDDLGSAAASFEEASAALTTFGRVLDTLQTRARGLLAQANQAQQRIDDANLSLARAAASAEREIALQGLDPLAAMFYRRQALSPHQQAVSEAEAWLRSLRSEASGLRREHEAAARRASDGFGRASNVGIHQTFRDRVTHWAAAKLMEGTWFYQEVNEVSDRWKGWTTGLVLAAAGLTVVTGGAASPALVLALKASATVHAVDVGARIARRGLGDETMIDSNAQLAGDAGLALFSFAASSVAEAAIKKGRAAISLVETSGYSTKTYQQVNSAHQLLNQGTVIVGIDSAIKVYQLGVKVRRSFEVSDGIVSPSRFTSPLPHISPVNTTTSGSVPDGSRSSGFQAPTSVPLQGSSTAPPLQGNAGDVPGLQPVIPTIRMTPYQRPIEVRQ